MRLIRTAKTAASRVDETYVKRPRRARLIMAMAVVAVSAASFLWWVAHQSRGNAALYSPGRVASVHAALNSDCAQCHDGDGKGGFLRAVSDNACLKCHADVATAHNPHQSTMVREISLSGAGHPQLSSNCIACHNEHRGPEALLSRTDSTCLQCHRDVTKFTSGAPRSQAVVTKFAVGAHPAFGRGLVPAKPASPGAMQDPTPLMFSHKEHMSQVKPREGETENCTVCHEPPAVLSEGIGIQPNRGYMQPVNYEKHCASCHKMEVVAGTNTPVPHVRLDSIRPLLVAYSDPEGYFRQTLAAMPTAQRAAALTEQQDTFGPPPLRKKKTVTVQHTPEEWAAQQAKSFWAAIGKWYTDDSNQLQGLDQAKTAIGGQADFPAELKNPATLEFYITHGKDKNDNKCGLCHKLSDDTAAVKRLAENAGPPMARDTAIAYRKGSLTGGSTTPATTGPAPTTMPGASHFDTLPTGIASAPRRWYVNSVFDHGAHRFSHDVKTKTQRALGCQGCHVKAMSSEQMSDVLLPGIESCVECHHPPDETGPGAADSCLACHPFYHDRSLQHASPPPPLSAMLSPAPAIAQP